MVVTFRSSSRALSVSSIRNVNIRMVEIVVTHGFTHVLQITFTVLLVTFAFSCPCTLKSLVNKQIPTFSRDSSVREQQNARVTCRATKGICSE